MIINCGREHEEGALSSRERSCRKIGAPVLNFQPLEFIKQPGNVTQSIVDRLNKMQTCIFYKIRSENRRSEQVRVKDVIRPSDLQVHWSEYTVRSTVVCRTCKFRRLMSNWEKFSFLIVGIYRIPN